MCASSLPCSDREGRLKRASLPLLVPATAQNIKSQDFPWTAGLFKHRADNSVFALHAKRKKAGGRSVIQILATKSMSSLLPVLHEIPCSFTNLPLLFHVCLHPAPLARMGLSNQSLCISWSMLFLPFASTGSFFFLQGSGCQQRKRSCNSKQKLRYCFLVDPASQQRQAGASICEMALFILSVLLRSQATTQAKLLSPNCMWQEIHIQLIWK